MRKLIKEKPIECVLVACLCLTLTIVGVFVWQHFNSGHDVGATVTTTNGRSVEEIKAELNEQVKDSMMTISVASKCRIVDGKVRVNVVNADDNKYDQSFELVQNDKVIYSSGLIRPGESVEWCDAPDAVAGDAIITISAHNSGETKTSGNPQSAQVKLVES